MPLNQSLRKNCHILWTISLIQDQNPQAQTKTEFAEMVDDVIATETVEHVTLCLADDLQRFRLMIQDGINEEDAIKKCQEMNDKWHQDNAESLKKLKENRNFSLLTWEEFLAWPDRINTIKALENCYNSDRGFRNDVDGRIRQALQGISSSAKLSDPVQQTILLKQYLFEECAFQKFAATKKFQYELYKTPTSKAMRRIKNNSEFVPPGYMVEVYFTQFNPSTKKQRTNQSQHVMPFSDKSLLPLPLSTASQENIFLPLFTNHRSKNHRKLADCPSSQTEETNLFSTSPGKKVAEFIEKTIQLLPDDQQEEAVNALIEFTTKNIIPMRLNAQKTVRI